MIDPRSLAKIYNQYGFEAAKCREDGIYVFTIRSGHFHNADIVKIGDVGDEEKVFDEFKRSGYACKIRKYQNTEAVEKELFKGFFSVDSTKSRLEKEYDKHAEAITKIHSDNGTYSYINSKYTINEKQGEWDVVNEIYSRLASRKPILFLVEAAAGFGKTCTAFELLKKITNLSDDKVPLFSELSRNRQAKIFRYVLLDEIDRSFPLLSSALVRSEIQNGNVPVILDGFDELLHQSKNKESEGYDNTEPMLETIGELLKKSAKVILTTRRTAIFDGDEFHNWVETHNDDFEIYRIRISEPTINDWIPLSRLDELRRLSFPIERLNNPVLLSYIRCITDQDFLEVIDTPDLIVEKYFNSMLERERKRQDLRVLPNDQYKILKHIAKDMIALDYTSESRDYISDLIADAFSELLDNARKQYPADERPTLDELVTKLAGHALLDRSADDGQGIGFVNEFVLGNFCSELIMEETSGEWVGNSRFVEPSVVAAMPRSQHRREKLWRALKFFLEFLPAKEKLSYTIDLTGKADIELSDNTIESLEINNVELGKSYEVRNYLFIGCTFTNTTIYTDRLINVTFVNCKFYNCKIDKQGNNGEIFTLGCHSDSTEFLSELSKADDIPNGSNLDQIEALKAEIYVLEKFWPKGRPTFTKHRPIKGICANNNTFRQDQILSAISALKNKQYLFEGDKISFLELNMIFIPEIKTLLGKV
ncbi:hypothetical protein [Pseudomonas sp. 2FG]|uniref:hypothetical protein n=1 Tax=Pseudomonas sp. 2FG TaxID=2502191 RepID=UPI0010F71A72|nr:hypothetical protein [Pseudomonas sp. 2FG]